VTTARKIHNLMNLFKNNIKYAKLLSEFRNAARFDYTVIDKNENLKSMDETALIDLLAKLTAVASDT